MSYQNLTPKAQSNANLNQNDQNPPKNNINTTAGPSKSKENLNKSAQNLNKSNKSLNQPNNELSKSKQSVKNSTLNINKSNKSLPNETIKTDIKSTLSLKTIQNNDNQTANKLVFRNQNFEYEQTELLTETGFGFIHKVKHLKNENVEKNDFKTIKAIMNPARDYNIENQANMLLNPEYKMKILQYYSCFYSEPFTCVLTDFFEVIN
jgi:hypothetical protein